MVPGRAGAGAKSTEAGMAPPKYWIMTSRWAWTISRIPPR